MSNSPESGAEGYLAALDQVISEHLIEAGCVVAVGEWGLVRSNPFRDKVRQTSLSLSHLDYDRLHFSNERRDTRMAFRWDIRCECF